MSDYEWRELDGVWVGSHGVIRRGPLLTRGSATHKGYRCLSFRVCGTRLVHRVVALAFIPNPDGKPQVNHKDGNPSNNEVSNLEWATNQENMMHARRVLKIGLRPIIGRHVETGEVIRFESTMLAGEAGFKRANIHRCIVGKRKAHGGYAWSYDALQSGASK